MASILPLHDATALRALEAEATAMLGGDALVLMERAGEAGWRCLLRHWPGANRIVVACGPGNNGGDGYVLARHAIESGRTAGIVRLPGHAPRTPLAQRACEEYTAAGGSIEEFDGRLPDCDLVVDALFGIGLSRAPDAATAALIGEMDACGAPVFALDVPSGIDADRGSAPGAAVHAARTLQFLAGHAGLYTGMALEHAGHLDVDALGVDAAEVGVAPATASLLLPEAIRGWLHPRRRNAHKGDSGRVLCIGGDAGSGGAIVLCAEAALRCGAGLVSVATRTQHVGAVLARRPEAMVRAVEASSGLEPMLAAADVVALGPGLGQGDWGRELHEAVLAAGKPVVLDADGLNLLANTPRRLPADSILTPHPGEAARLLAGTANDVQRDRFAAARALSERYGCVVVLKGAGTIVVAPDATPAVVGAGNPGMAVGGMGDLLTGTIAALHAQGLPAFDAACCGALLHAMAGDAAAAEGERGLLPSDLLPQLHRLANP